MADRSARQRSAGQRRRHVAVEPGGVGRAAQDVRHQVGFLADDVSIVGPATELHCRLGRLMSDML